VSSGDHDKTYHHGDLRRALVRCALELLEEKGSAALTLRAVARRAGVSHAAPYRHFSDRSALIEAVAEEGFAALERSLLEALAAAGADPVRRLLDPGLAYVRFAMTHAAHYRVMFGPEVAANWYSGTTPGKAVATFQFLIDSVVQGQRAGIVSDGEPFPLALGMWSLTHGTAMLLVDGMIPAEAAEALTASVLQQHFIGLASDGARAAKREPGASQ